MASQEAPYPLKPGDRLGRYQLLVPVGAGGMGRVWAARRTGTMPAKQLVAIKTGLGEVGGNAEFERLFMDEARIASMIEHPNVCGLYELSEQRGVLYLVMEWSDGATLREVLDASPDRRIACDLAARILAGVCAGLHAAHELEDVDGTPLSVVHRDVSPQNVLIAAAGHVKVADFGVAKAAGQLHRPTETGEMKGKLSYMAPEQVTSKEIDRRADIFALGCVLYEATLGRRPYQGGDALSTLYQLLEREIDAPRTIDPAYPPELERIVMRALAKEPDARFQTASEMEHALESWLASTRSVVTEARVAELMQASCGELIERKRQLVRQTIKKIERRALEGGAATLADPSSTDPTVRPVEPVSSSGDTYVQTPETPYRLSRPPRRVGTWVAAGAVAGLSLVVLVAALLGAKGSRAASQIPAAPVNSAADAPVPAGRMTLTIRTLPSEAQLRMDDGPPLPNPYVSRLPLDGSRHAFVASADGYSPKTRAVVLDRDQELLIELSPLPAAPPPELASSLPAGRVRPGTESARAGSSPSAEPKTSDLPRGRDPAPRKLDSENPFEVSPQ